MLFLFSFLNDSEVRPFITNRAESGQRIEALYVA